MKSLISDQSFSDLNYPKPDDFSPTSHLNLNMCDYSSSNNLQDIFEYYDNYEIPENDLFSPYNSRYSCTNLTLNNPSITQDVNQIFPPYEKFQDLLNKRWFIFYFESYILSNIYLIGKWSILLKQSRSISPTSSRIDSSESEQLKFPKLQLVTDYSEPISLNSNLLRSKEISYNLNRNDLPLKNCRKRSLSNSGYVYATKNPRINARHKNFKMSEVERKLLEDEFNRKLSEGYPFLNGSEIQELSKITEVPKKIILKYFSNRRANLKKSGINYHFIRNAWLNSFAYLYWD